MAENPFDPKSAMGGLLGMFTTEPQQKPAYGSGLLGLLGTSPPQEPVYGSGLLGMFTSPPPQEPLARALGVSPFSPAASDLFPYSTASFPNSSSNLAGVAASDLFHSFSSLAPTRPQIPRTRSQTS